MFFFMTLLKIVVVNNTAKEILKGIQFLNL